MEVHWGKLQMNRNLEARQFIDPGILDFWQLFEIYSTLSERNCAVCVSYVWQVNFRGTVYSRPFEWRQHQHEMIKNFEGIDGNLQLFTNSSNIFVQLILLNINSKLYEVEQIKYRVTIFLVLYFCTTITLQNSYKDGISKICNLFTECA